MNRQAVIDYIVARGKEASTWRGIVLLLTGLGVGMKPEFADAIVSAGVIVAGLIGVAFADSKPADPPPKQ